MTYTQEAKYSSGTLGFVDVDCDFIDLTYVSWDAFSFFFFFFAKLMKETYL